MAEEAYDGIRGYNSELPEAMINIDSNIALDADDHFDSDYATAMETSVHPGNISNDERDFAKMSDHITVWVDKYIGDKKQDYSKFQSKFENLQVLKSNSNEKNTVDDDTMVFADPDMLANLSKEYYCLKYFPEIPQAVEFIRQNRDKRIFFISSGTIGKEIIPQICQLSQIKGIYIFCGNISAHVEWAAEYVDYITAILEHQDNLLTRLSRDIAEYLETKGDRYRQEGSMIAARNCYSWAKKLLLRSKELGDNGAIRLIKRVGDKYDDAVKSAETTR